MKITTLMSCILIRMILSKPRGLKIENFTERDRYLCILTFTPFSQLVQRVQRRRKVPADGQYLPSVKELCSCIEAR